jgi:glycosyltransferase involved in cell wall biosynthesis
MRICFISRRYFPAISGMSIYAQNYLREMVKLGHDVVMISQYRNDQAGTRIYGGGPPGLINGVDVIGLESHGEQLVNLGQAADFEADINAMVDAALAKHALKPFDIVHAQYAYPNGLAAIEISRRTGIPNTISIQGGDGHWVGLCCATHRDAIRAVFNHANELIIGSASFAQEVHENHNIPLDRFTIIPGAINAEYFSPRLDRKLGEIESPPKLLYHGRVDRRKGVLELIEAFNLLKLAGRTLRLCISGIGPDLLAAKALVQTLNLNKEIEFPGYVSYEDVPNVYRSADIFVSPTWSEGFSNTILEAMASGLPIVAARAVGVVDCLTHQENALLHKVHDIADLSSKITQLLDDPELRYRLATAAMEEIESKYKWSAIALNINNILKNNLQKTPDNQWIETYKPTTTIADADLTCRFRQTPHLL